jgi:GNAT superfamily N-acetyltransferase
MTTTPAVATRPGRPDDIPFLARIIEIASTPPFPQSLWRAVLDPVDTPTLPFVQALLAEDAFAWGRVQDFVVLTVDGTPAAACAVFMPDAGNRHPLRMDRMPAVAARLGWDAARLTRFRAAYDGAFTTGDDTALVPLAGAIIEAVGVLPDYRGLGLGDRLMQAAKAAARSLGAPDLGVSAITGNDAAHRLYARHFAPVVTLHPALFDGQFPGETKYRAVLAA